MENQKELQPTSQLLNIFNITIEERARFIANTLFEHKGQNKKYETDNMFQGYEIVKGERKNRRVYKTDIDKPILSTESEIKVVKLYTHDSSVERAKKTLYDFLIEYRRTNEQIRTTEKAAENSAITKCSH